MNQQKTWNFPSLMIDAVKRPHGLGLVIAGRRHGKTEALQTLIDESQAEKERVTLFVADDLTKLHTSGPRMSISTQEINAQFYLPKKVDCIVIDSERMDLAERALTWSEMGYQVLMSWSGHSMLTSLERFIDFCGPNRARAWQRFSDNIQFSVGLKLLPGLDNKPASAFELMLATPEIREHLFHGNVNALQKIISASADPLGMRSMNQALLQNLVKRKIEFRTAFENSSAPEELDQKLKQLGI